MCLNMQRPVDQGQRSSDASPAELGPSNECRSAMIYKVKRQMSVGINGLYPTTTCLVEPAPQALPVRRRVASSG